MKSLIRTMFAPRLYTVSDRYYQHEPYIPNIFEKWADQFITLSHKIMKIMLYTSPFIILHIFKSGHAMEQTNMFMKYTVVFGGMLVPISYLIRAYGRSQNCKYMDFLKILDDATLKPRDLDEIRCYDFEFYAWPVTFKMPLLPMNISTYIKSWMPWTNNTPNSDLPLYRQTIIKVLACLATHTIGLRMMYPCSVGFVNSLMWNQISRGRRRLVVEFAGKRAKICTADGNSIDTMFVDRRSTDSGETLVICFEGNAGCYEDGIMVSPLTAGYSTLGWNHPGFGCSTGQPYPPQETNAADAVMQYAITVLNFKPEDIVLYGWSIGGYSASWLACNYPVKGLILDATFDDIIHLALKQMPESWSRLVREVVRCYLNLDIATMLKEYRGPIKLVRRTEDEIMCIKTGDIATNRANELLKSIIRHRYPKFLTDGELSACLNLYLKMKLEHLSPGDATSAKKQSVLRLITAYMKDCSTNHCTALSKSFFKSLLTDIEKNVPPRNTTN